MSTLEIKSNLLAKALWSLNDIMEYVECSKTTASKIRQKAIKLGGISELFPQKSKRESVLEALGIDCREEIQIIEKLKGVNK